MISLVSCANCKLFMPPPADRCPNCGGSVETISHSGSGRVLAATELHAPAAGWTSPHRLVVAELEGGGSVLALAGGALPGAGERGQVEVDPSGRWIWRSRSG